MELNNSLCVWIFKHTDNGQTLVYNKLREAFTLWKAACYAAKTVCVWIDFQTLLTTNSFYNWEKVFTLWKVASYGAKNSLYVYLMDF